MVWDWGPIATEDSVGLTKNPVQPTAETSAESAANSNNFRVQFRIVQTTPKLKNAAKASLLQLTKL